VSSDDNPIRVAARKPRFAQVWETALSEELSDSAVRLYAVLDRYEGANEAGWPTRAVLAQKCGAWSLDKLDRVVKELIAAGLLTVEHRLEGPEGHRHYSSNLYTLTPFEATVTPFTTRRNTEGGGRTDAARGGRTSAARGGRTGAARGGRTSAAQKEPHVEGAPN